VNFLTRLLKPKVLFRATAPRKTSKNVAIPRTESRGSPERGPGRRRARGALLWAVMEKGDKWEQLLHEMKRKFKKGE
jgi:hypothetical protein